MFGLAKFLCRQNILRVSKFLKGPISPKMVLNQCVFWDLNSLKMALDKSHEAYSDRPYNRERMKGITEVRKLI